MKFIPSSLTAIRIGKMRLGTPFVIVHLIAILGPIWVGVSIPAVLTGVALYLARVFGITAFFHRGLSHKAFKMSRGVQFAGAALGTASAQQGPLWWVAHHRVHHRVTDKEGDLHSPRVVGFWRSHMGWVFEKDAEATQFDQVKDLARYPEILWLDKHPYVVPTILGFATYFWGVFLDAQGFGTTGMQMLVVGFFLSTVALYHATFMVNSLAHIKGSQPFESGDDSRNNAFVAVLTLGEGWHNNHHMFPRSARMGFGWKQLDPTWMVLKLMEKVHLISDLKVSDTDAPRRPRQTRLAA